MRNPIQAIKDWTAVKKMKEGLLAALQQTPPGACISIQKPNDPIVARAVIELLSEHPNDLRSMDYGFEVTLMRTVGMAQSMHHTTFEKLSQSHSILSAESLATLGLRGGHVLPAHRFRDGVPDDINGKKEHVKADDVKILGPNDG